MYSFLVVFVAPVTILPHSGLPFKPDREVVIPAYAGIQNFLEKRELSNWIPAFAGMTGQVLIPKVSRLKWEAHIPKRRLQNPNFPFTVAFFVWSASISISYFVKPKI